MSKAWAFYRRSTDKQDLSIPDQRRECQAYAAANGLEITREFEPSRGYASGLTIDRDPEFLKMVRLAQNGSHGVRYLLVYDVSRFGRLPTKTKVYWEEHFRRYGIEVRYAKEGFKNDGTIGDDITQLVKHSEAHEYSRKLSELVLRGAKSHAKLGHSTGGRAPYGFDRMLVDETGNQMRILKRREWKESKLQRVILAPSHTQAPVVQWIFETYAKGIGLNTIVGDLNARKVAAPRGLHWSKSIIHFMLRNRSYLGERSYNKRSYKAYRRGEKGDLFNSKAEWIAKPDAHEAIVTPELFGKVAARFSTWKRRTAGTMRRPYLLTGIAVCARCGYKLTGRRSSNNRGYGNFIYECSGYVRCGRSVCDSMYLPTEQLDGVTLQTIRENLADPNWKHDLEEIMVSVFADEFGQGAENRVESLKAQIAKAEQEIVNFVDAVRSGTFSPSIAKALQDTEARLEALRIEQRQAQSKSEAMPSPQGFIASAMNVAKDFDRVWKSGLEPQERKELIQGFVHQVNVNREGSRMYADCWLHKIPLAVINKPAGLPFERPGHLHKGLLRGTDFNLCDGVYEAVPPLLTVRRQELIRTAAIGGLR